MAYSFEMVMVGMILLSAMVAGGIALAIKRRREAGWKSSPVSRRDPRTAAAVMMAAVETVAPPQKGTRSQRIKYRGRHRNPCG